MSEAKSVLLQALDHIESIEAQSGGTVWALTVAFSVTSQLEDGSTQENGGWSSTGEPAWVTAALLRRTADAIEACVVRAEPDGSADDED